MSNEFRTAFTEFLDTREQIFGGRQKANVNGTDIDADITELTFDEVIVAGGKGESGGFDVQVPVAAFVTKPAQFSPVIVDGVTLKILSAKKINDATYTLICGDPASES